MTKSSRYKRRILLALIFTLIVAAMLGSALAQQERLEAKPGPVLSGKPTEQVMRYAGSTTMDLRRLPHLMPRKRTRIEREEPETEHIEIPNGNNIQTDSAISLPSVAPQSAAAPAPNITFDGLDFANFGAGHPPDPNGDVGPTYYIQTLNTSIGIFRKSDGVRVAAFSFDAFMSQGHFGDIRDTDNFGDPVVLYDTFEDRWVITDFAFTLDASNNVVNPPGSFQVIAVSKTGDPVSGGWNFYSTNTAGGLGDYPKFGIWTDGLYMSANMFGYPAGAAFQNPRVYAFNKAQMYAGAPTVQVVTFDAPAADFAVMPSNARLQTGTPPPGTPAYFVSTWEFLNALTVYKFHVDWDRPSLSTFTGPDAPLASTSWPNASVANAPSQGGNNLDVLQIRAMVQNQYSNIGGVESLWIAHTVRRQNTTGFAAPRWYQVNVTGGTVAANLPQAATWDPDGANVMHRFMPSVAVDRAGDMAIGYSTSSSTTKPAIKYAGRLASDPINTFSQTEQLLFQGTGTQTGNCGGSSCIRWGDYSAMTLDPNGCTFWYTNEYYAVDGLNYQTRIGSFSFPGCTQVGNGGTISGTVTATVGGAPINGATVKLGSRTTTTDSSGFYSFSSIPAGTYPVITASDPGFSSSTSVSIVVNDSSTTTQNFSLNSAATSACLTDTTQADFQTGVPTSVDLNTSPGDVILLNAPSVNQQNTTLGTSGVGVTVTTWGGQTFTPSVTGTVPKIDLNMFCSGCTGTTPNLTLSIRATSGGLPTGADIASATITGFNSGASAFYTATFATPPTLTAGTQYALAIRPTANPSLGTYALTRSGTSTAGADVYAGGTRVAGATSGTVWSIPLTGGVSTDAGFRIYMQSGFPATGDLISGLKDSNPAAGLTPTWTTISWTATIPANTNLQFQVAASDSDTGPFNFVGPDGTAATFYTTSGASLSQFNGHRYLKYRAYFSTTDNTMTPTLNDVTVCYNDVDCSGSATITPSPSQVCANSTGNTASGPAGGSNYVWMITNGTITSGGTSQTVTYTAGASGNVTLQLSLMAANGCQQTGSANVPIVVVPTPTITAGGPTTFCAGGSVTLTSSSATGNQWYKDGNAIGGATNQTFTATTSGSYTVTVTSGSCTSAASSPTTVTSVPVQTATVGGPQFIAPSGTTGGLGGNTPTSGTGTWTVRSGGTGTFSDIHAGNATFTHTGGAGPIILRWTISNPPCADSFAEVTVTVGVPPTITCPTSPMVVNATTGQCQATVSFTPSATGAPIPTVTCAPPSGSVFSVGNTTVNCTASNGIGSPATCSFVVKVKDTQPPSFTGGCPTGISAITAFACPLPTSAPASYTTPSATDNCSATVACVPPSGSVFSLGTTTVTCTATDPSGNTATCSFPVTVYNLCLQDEVNRGNVVLINSQTGQYQFCCNGQIAASGTGTVTVRGCTVTLSHVIGNKRVTASSDLTQKKGTASLQLNSQLTCSINDTNILNNSCACPAP